VSVELVPATPELVDDELSDPALLAERLGAELPADWPPEHHGEQVLEFTSKALEDPAAAGWWLHWFVWLEGERRVLAGTGGFKGPPDDGVVEIGYSVVPSWQRRGIATDAIREFIARARERGARAVIAHTLPSLEPSIGVLRKLGFEPAGSPEPGVIGFRLDLEG
jgi:RimJ/RimL family protein N-acetyltransferase